MEGHSWAFLEGKEIEKHIAYRAGE